MTVGRRLPQSLKKYKIPPCKSFLPGLYSFENILNFRNIPRSIFIAVPLVTGLYVFMNVAYLTVLTIPEMIEATAVAIAFGEKALGSLVFLIPIGVAISTFGCALSLQFGVTRYKSYSDMHL